MMIAMVCSCCTVCFVIVVHGETHGKGQVSPQNVLVLVALLWPMSRPEPRGIVIRPADQDMANRVPVQTPDIRVMGALQRGYRRLGLVLKPKLYHAVTAPRGKQVFMDRVPADRIDFLLVPLERGNLLHHPNVIGFDGGILAHRIEPIAIAIPLQIVNNIFMTMSRGDKYDESV